jgi:hypothetical protein
MRLSPKFHFALIVTLPCLFALEKPDEHTLVRPNIVDCL